MTTQLKVWLVALGITLAGFLIWRWDEHQQAIGALKVQLHQADSAHAVALQASHDSLAVFLRAKQEADSLRANARREVARDVAERKRTDSLVVAAHAEREAATAVLQDSVATVFALRGTVVRLLELSRQDSTDLRAARARIDSLSQLVGRILTTDSTAIQRGLAATNAAIARATTAERQTEILQHQQPSVVGNLLRDASLLAIGYGVGRIVR